MNSWIFQGNPKRFAIDDYLSQFSYVYWSTPQHQNEIQLNDAVYFWRAGDDSGAIALGTVVELPVARSEVRHRDALADDLWRDREEGPADIVTGIKISEARLSMEDGTIPRSVLTDHPTLASSTIIRQPQQTVFRLTADQSVAMAHLWGTQDYATEQTDGDIEGHRRLRKHYVRERSHHLVKAKKRDYLASHAQLRCEVCGFAFSDRYPKALAEGFIEVHHIVPISEVDEVRRTKLSDLMLVCSNCHSMIHRTNDAKSNLELLRTYFKK